MKEMHGKFRWAVGLAAVAASLMAVEGRVSAQTTTTVFQDTFTSGNSATWTTSGTIGTSLWSVTRSGDDWGARINTSQLELTNDASGTTNLNGWVYASTPTSGFTSPWSSTLSSNPGLVTWEFNMRQIRSDPAGFTAGSYGAAFVLGGNSTTVATSGTGYAIVLGQSGATDPIRLATFAGGLQGTLTNVITGTGVFADIGAEYLSVRVTYNPTGNIWLMYGGTAASSFGDPTGTLSLTGSATSNTYTGTPLTSMGGYWQGSTAANQTAFFDNVYVKVQSAAASPGNYWAPGVGGGGTGTWASGTNVWATAAGSQGTLAQATTGTLFFTDNVGTVTVSGSVSAAAGMQISTSGYVFTGGTIGLTGATLAANTITVDSSVTGTINSILSGTAGLTKSGAGVLVLGGANTYTGTTSLAAGVLQFNSTSAIPGPLTVATGTLRAGTSGTVANNVLINTDLRIDNDGTGLTPVFSGTFSGAGRLRVNVASGTTTFTGSNSYSGATDIGGAGATVIVGNNSAFGTGAFTISNGALDVTSGSSFALANSIYNWGAGTINFTGLGNLQATSGTSRFASTGGTTLNVNNSGTLTLGVIDMNLTTNDLRKGGTGTLVITGSAASSFAAGSTLQGGGAVAIGHQTALGTGTIALNNAIFRATTDLSGASAIQNPINVLANSTIGGTNNMTFAGAVTGSAARNLTIANTGITRFSGVSSYSGTTSVSAGTLLVTGSLAGPIAVSTGATLGGSGTVGVVSIASGATLSPGTSPGLLTTGNMTWDGGGNYNWQLLDASGTAGIGYDSIWSSGILTINATSGNKFNLNLWTLQSANPDVSGSAANFNPLVSTTFTLGSFASISGFAADRFNILTGSSNGTGGFANVYEGTFSIANPSTGVLSLVYTAPAIASWDYVGGAGLWSTAANWNPATTPSGTAPLTFSGTGGVTDNDLSSFNRASSLTFASGAGGYTISGSSLALGSGGVANNSSTTQTIAAGLSLAVSSTFAANTAPLTITGTVNNAGNTLTVTGSSTTTLGVVDGTGAFSKTGSGTATLTGAVAAPNVTVSAGAVLMNGANLLADSGTVTVSGGTLNVQGNSDTVGSLVVTSGSVAGSGGTLTASTYTLSGGGVGANLGSGNLTVAGNATLGGVAAVTGLNLDSGTLTLGSAGRFTAAPVVTGSTGAALVLGGNESLGSLAGAANVTLGSAALTVGSANSNTTYSGVISGGGSLEKVGSGALTLAGNNSYSGGSTVTSGSLIGTTASLQGAITNNAAVAFDQTTAGTYAGDISGSGSLTKLGSGTVTLSGNNSYSGGSTVSAGRLVGTTSSLQGGIVNNAAVTFDQAANGTYAGTMSGSGSLTKTGNGAVTLSGNNGYSGGSTVSGGSLIGTTSSLQGAITNNAAVTFDQSTAGTYAGNMSGSGSLTKLGSGTVTLSGNNSYSGGSTVSAGRLVGTTSSLQGGIVNNAAVTFDQSTTGTYAGNISGSGSLTKAGSGNVTLSGNNTYAGPTVVDAGTLTTATSTAISQNVTVNSGATLALGAAQSFTDLSGNGTLAAGNSAMTFNIAGTSSFGGTLTGNAGSTLTKTGAGTMNFDGTTSGYLGSVTVNQGVITGVTSFGSGTVTMNAGSAYGEAGGTIGNAFAIGSSSFTSGSFSGYWNFGTTSGNASATTVTGAGVTFGDVSRGNNNGTTNALLTITSPSDTYPNASGQFNAGAAARIGAFNSGTSAYFEFTVTGTGGYTFDVESMTFGSRSTSTGPTALAVYRTTDLSSSTGTAAAVANTSWALESITITGTATGGTVTYRIYGYNGTGSPGANTTNWRIDDLTVSGSSFLASSNPATAALGINEAGATTFSGPIAVTGTANLFATTGGTATFTGAISGTAGAIAKTGAGTVILTGTNTYGGGVTVSQGTLQGTTDSLRGSIANAAAVVFSQSTSGSYSGAISGAGNLTKLGTGTVSLTGANTYSGSTGIAAGTLRVSGGGDLKSSSQINVGPGATLAFANSDIYDGKLAGTGNLVVEAGSTLTIAGANVFSGSTTVLSGGVLQLDGQINNTSLYVNAGATLMGTGSSAGLTTIEGLHSPGSSPGIQTFDSLTYLASGTMRWELVDNTVSGPGINYDQVLLTGSLTFNSATTFELVFNGGGSIVDWEDTFWDSDREWRVYDQYPTGGVLPATLTSNYEDIYFRQLNSVVNPVLNIDRQQAYFQLKARSGSTPGVYLVYRATPEPSTHVLAGLGLATIAWVARRRRRRGAHEHWSANHTILT